MRWVVMGMLLSVVTAEGARAAEVRFEARLQDGTRINAPAVANWHAPDVQPSLAGRNVFDPSNPFRWLIDTSLPVPQTPDAYVEFVGGDRLPGEIVGVASGNESPYDHLPKHLLIRPHVAFQLNGRERHDYVRITEKWLRRVVWQRRLNGEYRPGTLVLRDGREMTFRALRWKADSVSVLRDSGIEEFPFHLLAEAHLPLADQWNAWFEQLAVLTPSCTARLVQFETTDGLRLTTSSERLFSISTHDSHRPHGAEVGASKARQLSPLASSRAAVVLPTPRMPEKQYAWATRPCARAFDRVRTTAVCPTTSSNFWGRHLRAMTW